MTTAFRFLGGLLLALVIGGALVAVIWYLGVPALKVLFVGW